MRDVRSQKRHGVARALTDFCQPARRYPLLHGSVSVLATGRLLAVLRILVVVSVPAGHLVHAVVSVDAVI